MKIHIDELRDHRFIPDHAVEQAHETLDLVFYLYPGHDSSPFVFALCYEGRKLKPSFQHRFKTEGKRNRFINQWIEDRQKEIDYKLKRQTERHAFKTSLTEDCILSGAWGYEQTQVEFWQVVKKKSDKTVVIRQIAKKLTDNPADHSTNSMAGKVIPLPGEFLDKGPIEKSVAPGEIINFSSYRRLSLWNGKPQYCSWYG